MRGEGMKKVLENLNALPDRLLARGKAAAVSAAAYAAEIAREHAPVDTGELRQSISHSQTEQGAAVIAAAPHAVMVEFGTVKMPPRPFMLEAARASADVFFSGIKNLRTR